MNCDSSSEDEAHVYHEAHTLTAPTITVIEHLNPETFDLNDISARPLSIASSSNLIEVQEPLDWINPELLHLAQIPTLENRRIYLFKTLYSL